MTKFAIRLRELRKEKKVMVKDLSEMLSVTPRAFNYYENGIREPNYSNLITLADYFGVSVDYMLGRTDNPEVNK